MGPVTELAVADKPATSPLHISLLAAVIMLAEAATVINTLVVSTVPQVLVAVRR